MSRRDELAELQAADPAAGLDLDRVEDQAWQALREGIPMTTTSETPTAARHRRSRRPLIAGGLAIALMGGGAAVAMTNLRDYYVTGGEDGLTCMTTWQTLGVDNDQTYGGATISSDPVADCAEYAQLTGRTAITDPVAVRWNANLVVGPREGLPPDAEVLDKVADPGLTPVAELNNSMEDFVDGGESRCFDTPSAMAFAKSELNRLGLTGWTITVEDDAESRSGSCSGFVPDPMTSTVLILEHRGSSGSFPILRPLREQIAGRCLTLAQAKKVATQILSAEGPTWPISTTTDPAARCTRIDLVVGGNFQVFLYGP